MLKDTNLAAGNNSGNLVLYRDSSYPAPVIIDTFEKYHKGSAGMLLKMVQKDQNDGFILANRNSLLEFWTRLLGLIFAFLLTAGMIGTGALLLLKGHPISGGFTLATGIVGIIGTIATGGRIQAQQQVQKKS